MDIFRDGDEDVLEVEAVVFIYNYFTDAFNDEYSFKHTVKRS